MALSDIVAGNLIIASELSEVLTDLTAKTLVGQTVRTTGSGTFTSETVLDYITFTAVAGATYELRASTPLQSSVAGDLITMRFRWIAAAALTTAGTEFHSVLPNADIAGKGQPFFTQRTISGLAAGQTSIGVTAARNSGTGNISSFASSAMNAAIWLYRIA